MSRFARLLHAHIFPYSQRKGTTAAKLSDQIAPEIKKERAARLLETAKSVSLDFAASRVGKTYSVLCEKIRGGEAFGYTENFIYTRTPMQRDIPVGSVFPVQLESESSFSVETMTVRCKSIELA